MDINEVRQKLTVLCNEYEQKEQKLLDPLPKELREELGYPIKKINWLDSFNANGNTYYIRTSLTIRRFEEFEKYQIRAGFGVDFEQMYNNIRQAFDYLNEGLPVNAGIKLHNILNGIKDALEERENEVLQICALFISQKNEDLTQFDEQVMAEKIADWKKEGIDMQSFFSLAFNSVSGFTPIYQEVSGVISQRVKAAKKGKKQNPKKNT